MAPAEEPPATPAVLEKGAELALEPGARMWFLGIRSSSSLAGSWIRALMSCTACLVDSVPPLMVIILSPFLSFCLSTSM